MSVQIAPAPYADELDEQPGECFVQYKRPPTAPQGAPAGADEPSASDVVAHKLLGVIATLSPETALNGREIGVAAGLDGREAQKVLPFLAKRGRVSREKRREPSRGNYYYYWMTAKQRQHFHDLVVRKHRNDRSWLMEKVKTLRSEVGRLEGELAAMRHAHRTLLNRCAPGTKTRLDAVTLAERIVFIKLLRQRPSLEPLAMLKAVQDDYEHALREVRAETELDCLAL